MQYNQKEYITIKQYAIHNSWNQYHKMSLQSLQSLSLYSIYRLKKVKSKSVSDMGLTDMRQVLSVLCFKIYEFRNHIDRWHCHAIHLVKQKRTVIDNYWHVKDNFKIFFCKMSCLNIQKPLKNQYFSDGRFLPMYALLMYASANVCPIWKHQLANVYISWDIYFCTLCIFGLTFKHLFQGLISLLLEL